jgi:uncharacterized protein involved in exopolysaccharide biosynthesis
MVLALLAVTLFGVLGGLGASLILPVHYQADAYVVVYAMPRGFTSLIGPDEEVTLQNVYRAGVLQDDVLKKVQAQLPGYSADTIAEAIQVGGVAYTPLTRITATGSTADGAARLANVVATAWVDVAGAALSNAYTLTQSSLQTRQDDLQKQITTAQQALADADPTSPTAADLQAQLQTLHTTLSATQQALVALEQSRYDVAGNAWVAVPATASSAVRYPDTLKSLGVGAVVGISLGLILDLWLMSRQRKRQLAQSNPRIAALVPTAAAREATNGR